MRPVRLPFVQSNQRSLQLSYISCNNSASHSKHFQPSPFFLRTVSLESTATHITLHGLESSKHIKDSKIHHYFDEATPCSARHCLQNALPRVDIVSWMHLIRIRSRRCQKHVVITTLRCQSQSDSLRL